MASFRSEEGQLRRGPKPKEKAYGLTKQNRKEIEDIFHMFDIDGSGSIDVGELTVTMRLEAKTFVRSSMNVFEVLVNTNDYHLITVISGFVMNDEQINELMVEVDKNQSGAIDLDEFVYMMTSKFGERDSMNKLSKAFKIIDHDNNGKISYRDIKQIAKELGEEFTDKDIKEMIEEADHDKDGEVNLEEFMKMMQRTSYGNANEK